MIQHKKDKLEQIVFEAINEIEELKTFLKNGDSKEKTGVVKLLIEELKMYKAEATTELIRLRLVEILGHDSEDDQDQEDDD